METAQKLLKSQWKFSKNVVKQFILFHSAVFLSHIEVVLGAQVSWFPAPSPIEHIRVVFVLQKNADFAEKIPTFEVAQKQIFQNNVKKSMKIVFFEKRSSFAGLL